jgi:galactonate dehydratase
MGVAPHNSLGPVANAVALHFALSTPNFLIQEDMLSDVPWRWDVVKSSLVTEHGYWLPTTVPELGIEVDEARAKEHPLQQEVMHSLTIRAAGNAILDCRFGGDSSFLCAFAALREFFFVRCPNLGDPFVGS